MGLIGIPGLVSVVPYGVSLIVPGSNPYGAVRIGMAREEVVSLAGDDDPLIRLAARAVETPAPAGSSCLYADGAVACRRRRDRRGGRGQGAAIELAVDLAAGAAGFVLKDTGPQELIHAVRAAANGHAILSPRVVRGLVDRYVTAGSGRATEAQRLVGLLTCRERGVLLMVGLGLSNAEAGKRLFLGEGTVESHVRHILTKLGCANRVQAALLARDAGLLPRD